MRARREQYQRKQKLYYDTALQAEDTVRNQRHDTGNLPPSSKWQVLKGYITLKPMRANLKTETTHRHILQTKENAPHTNIQQVEPETVQTQPLEVAENTTQSLLWANTMSHYQVRPLCQTKDYD